MSTSDQYTPDEDALEVAWIEFSETEDINDATNEFERAINQIRRDAARDTILDLAEHYTNLALEEHHRGNPDGELNYHAIAAEIEDHATRVDR